MEEEKKVKTIDGSLELRSNCRYIKNEFYRIGDNTIEGSGQCYLVNGKYCRDGIGYIVYDHGLCEYVRKSESLVNGVIDLKEDRETPIYGYFTSNEVYNIQLYLKDSKRITVLEEGILNNSYYKERLRDGVFYHISNLDANDFNKISLMDHHRNGLEYNTKDIMSTHIKMYNNFNDSVPTKFVEDNYKKLRGLTFGFEFETTNGNIPKRLTSKLGLMALRDGSIRGLEYATIPLKGKKGLQTIIDISKELKKRTTYDESCSMHVHIGGVPRTMKFIIALYRVMINLEDEIYKCFPLYKKYSYGIKKKEYTKPLPTLNILPFMNNKITDSNIVDNFNVIYRYLSMGQNYKGNFSSLDDVHSHPSDPEGRSKWNIRSRYHAHNFIQLLFGNKQTIEFRIHNATDDSDKMLNFLFLNAGIINFTIMNQDKILNDFGFLNRWKIGDVLQTVYPDNLGYNLTDYFNIRRNNIRNNVQKNDIICSEKDMWDSKIKWSGKIVKGKTKEFRFNPGISTISDSRNRFTGQMMDELRILLEQPVTITEATAVLQPPRFSSGTDDII